MARVPDIDQAAAAELFSTAYRVAYRVLGSRHDAQDVAQEAVTRAVVRWSRVAPYALAWVSKLSMNMAIDMTRRRRRDRDRPRTGAPTLSAAADEWLDERLDLAAAVARLPRRQREVVVLRYVADLSEAAVAEQLGCSIGTVKQHASRGLQALRAQAVVIATEAT